MSEFCHPNCIQARKKQKDYDASQHAALGIHNGPSGSGTGTRCVGLRDVIIVGAKKTEEDLIVDVQICYMKKTSIVKVSGLRMLMRVPVNGDDDSVVTEPTGLLVDFCLPRLSIN